MQGTLPIISPGRPGRQPISDHLAATLPPKTFFTERGEFGSGLSALGVRSPLQTPARSHGQRICGRQESTTQKKGKTMNTLTQFKIRTLPLLIAPALITLVALTALPAGAAPPLTCGLT
jgi:hypothetical protein